MANLRKMIDNANIIKKTELQNSLKYFVVDDFIYKLSQEAIKDIRANEKKGVAYFKDLQTATLIELSEMQ